MAALFTSARIADLILVVMALEAIVLAVLYVRGRRGPAPLESLFNLGAGACLVLALRAALTGARWHVIATLLAASGVAHALDLWRRLRRRPRR